MQLSVAHFVVCCCQIQGDWTRFRQQIRPWNRTNLAW